MKTKTNRPSPTEDTVMILSRVNTVFIIIVFLFSFHIFTSIFSVGAALNSLVRLVLELYCFFWGGCSEQVF